MRISSVFAAPPRRSVATSRSASAWDAANAKPVGPPRALADAVRSRNLERFTGAGDGPAGEDAALGRREMRADHGLDGADRAAECRDVALDKAGQRLHEHQPAELGGRMLGKGRQGGEGVEFVLSVKASVAWIEDEDHPPFGRKCVMGDDRRRQIAVALATVHRDAATGEEGCTEAGAMPAPEQRRIAGRIGRQAFEGAQGPPRHRAPIACRTRGRNAPEWSRAPSVCTAKAGPAPGRSVTRWAAARSASGPSTRLSVPPSAAPRCIDLRAIVSRVAGVSSASPMPPKRRPERPPGSRNPRCNRAGAETWTKSSFTLSPDFAVPAPYYCGKVPRGK